MPVLASAIAVITVIVGAAYFDRVTNLALGLADLFGISSSPSNTLRRGVIINKEIAERQVVSVAFCDAGERHVARYHPGGDDFSWPCASRLFDLCVNASNSAEAVDYLDPVLTRFNAKVGHAVFFGHGSPAKQRIGRALVQPTLLELLKNRRATDFIPQISFYGCEVAMGEDGLKYIQHVADAYRYNTLAMADTVSWHVYSRDETTPCNFTINTEEIYLATPDGNLAQKFKVPDEREDPCR